MKKEIFYRGGVSAINIGSYIIFQWIVFASLGVGESVDAYIAATTIPYLFASIFCTALSNVLVSFFASIGEGLRDEYAWSLFIQFGFIFALFALLGVITSYLWVPLIVPGFSNENQQITVALTKIALFGMIFSGLSAIQMAVGHAKGRFFYTDVIPLVSNIISLVLLVIFLPRYGVWAAAWVSMIRLVIQVMLFLPCLGRWRGYKWKLAVLSHPVIHKSYDSGFELSGA